MGVGVHSTCCKLTLFTSTLGCQMTALQGLYSGGSGVSLPQAVTASASQTLPGAALPSAPKSPTPSPGPTPSLEALHAPEHSPHCSWLSPDLCSHWRTRSLGCLGSYVHPSQQLQTRGETEYSLGSCPQFTLNTFSLFCFIYWSSLRCLFKTSNVAFKKIVQSLCSTLRIKSSYSTLK